MFIKDNEVDIFHFFEEKKKKKFLTDFVWDAKKSARANRGTPKLTAAGEKCSFATLVIWAPTNR